MQTNETSQVITPVSPSAGAGALDVPGWCQRLGWRVTEARLAIIRAAQAMEGYFDAEELVARAHEFNAGASRATVYRALPRLCAAGLLRKTDVGEGRTRFSRSSPGEIPSAEIYVEDCGLIIRVRMFSKTENSWGESGFSERESDGAGPDRENTRRIFGGESPELAARFAPFAPKAILRNMKLYARSSRCRTDRLKTHGVGSCKTREVAAISFPDAKNGGQL